MGHAQEVCFIGLFLNSMKITAHFECYDIHDEYINCATVNWNNLIKKGRVILYLHGNKIDIFNFHI
jgi:hypothetical protein